MPVTAGKKHGIKRDIETVLETRYGKKRYETKPIEKSGTLRFEAGRALHLTKRELGRIALVGARYISVEDEIKALQQNNTEPAKELKRYALKNNGFLSFAPAKSESVLNMVPRDSILWADSEKLKKKLGHETYPALVHEELVVKVAVPIGLETKNGPLTSNILNEALLQGLGALGISKDSGLRMETSEIVRRVDEEHLYEMHQDGRVPSLTGLGEVATTVALEVITPKK